MPDNSPSIPRAKTALRGLVHGLVTPFEEAGDRVDFQSLSKLVAFHLEHGDPAALSPLLHLGESPSLSSEERRAVAEHVVNAVGGRVPVWVHVTASSTAAQIALARHAERIGAAGVIAALPYYRGRSAATAESHFKALAESVGIGLVLYNSPGAACGPELSPELIGRLSAAHENIVGLKDASFDAGYWLRMGHFVRPDENGFAHMSGIDYVWPTVVLGATGCVSVAAGVAPRLAARLWREAIMGAPETALVLQSRMTALLELLLHRYPASFKGALALLGRPVGPTRLPVDPLTTPELETLERRLGELGVFEQEPLGW